MLSMYLFIEVTGVTVLLTAWLYKSIPRYVSTYLSMRFDNPIIRIKGQNYTCSAHIIRIECDIVQVMFTLCLFFTSTYQQSC
jgi:hypothetical protein